MTEARHDESVNFVRHDDDGMIIGTGQMLRVHIERRQAAGENIEIVAEPPELPRPSTPDYVHLSVLRVLIERALAESDRYFTADAPDNVSADQQEQWRAYRRALRATYKTDDLAKAIGMLPTVNPKGADVFGDLRKAVGFTRRDGQTDDRKEA